MQRKRADVDIINDVLKASMDAYPSSAFVKSLSHQYQERGGLSKKQLEGLYQKALKIKDIPPNWLATLEAEILKRPNRYKSQLPAHSPLYVKEEGTGKKIEEILAKYPQHKRIIFFKSKYENNEPLSVGENSELEKFYKLLIQK